MTVAISMKNPKKTNQTSRRISDAELISHPALRISSIVTGRENRKNKVYYHADPKNPDSRKMIPEKVVLYRWKKRTLNGIKFDGTRLNPKIWRILPDLFGKDYSRWGRLTADDIGKILEDKRTSLRQQYIKNLPQPEALCALFQSCGIKRLKLIIKRHTDPDRSENFGTPDLFLYASRSDTGRVAYSRFVEVKKPTEPLSKDQKEEILFLQSIGLHARVLRLIERL